MAVIITVAIVIIWYIIKPVFSPKTDSQIDSATSTFSEINESIQKIGEDFNKIKGMFSNNATSSTSTTESDSTSSPQATTTSTSSNQ